MEKKLTNGESLAMNELSNRAQIQNRKYRYSLPFNTTLGPAGSATDRALLSLKIAAEGDFYATKFAAKILAETAKSGILIKIHETGYNKTLFRDFTELSLLASPGYGESFFPMIDFEQLFLSGSDVQIEMKNVSAEEQTVSGAFHGFQFVGSAKGLIPGYAG